jgi:hypothetical protein
MSVPLPALDTRRFDDLLEECRALIPAHDPDWTDHNASDVGITLIELFAWLAEMLMFRADQVATAHTVAFLQLLRGPDWAPSGDLDADIAATLREIHEHYVAITPGDWETLALEVSPLVARAHCLPERDLSAGADEGRVAPEPGYVSVVVVPASLTDFDTVAADVEQRLEPHRPLATRHQVTGPTWVPVAAELLVGRRSDATDAAVKQAVSDAIAAYLHPLTGGEDGRGWPFGRSLYSSEIVALLEALPEVDYVPEALLLSQDAALVAEPLWSDRGNAYGLRLHAHHLPQAAIDPDRIVVSTSFVRVRVTVTLQAPDGDLSDARRSAYAAVREFFHPLYGWPPQGSAPWTVAETRVAELVTQAAGLAATVTFDAEGARLSHDLSGTGLLELALGEIAELDVEIVRA